MAEEHLRGVVDSIRARLQAELEQLGNLAQTHEQAVQEARQRADADAEERWTSKLDAVHAQWGTRLESEVSLVRVDGG
jgi:FtsZ-binding cell division protein ZapB